MRLLRCLYRPYFSLHAAQDYKKWVQWRLVRRPWNAERLFLRGFLILFRVLTHPLPVADINMHVLNGKTKPQDLTADHNV